MRTAELRQRHFLSEPKQNLFLFVLIYATNISLESILEVDKTMLWQHVDLSITI